MWNQLRKLVSGKPSKSSVPETVEPPPTKLEFDDARPEVEAFLKIDISTEKAESEKGELALSAMKKMALDIDQIERSAKGNPENSIAGGLWLSGAGYGNLAQELTRRFRVAGWLTGLWARATLAVNARFHHLVGPAMLANADCQQRLGKAERATYIYTSVLKDFIFLIGSWQQKTEAPTDDDRIAIECLQTAIEGLLALDTTEVDGTDLKAVREHVSQILARSKTDG